MKFKINFQIVLLVFLFGHLFVNLSFVGFKLSYMNETALYFELWIFSIWTKKNLIMNLDFLSKIRIKFSQMWLNRQKFENLSKWRDLHWLDY